MYAYASHFVCDLAPQAQATVIALSGDLGVGKTTFVQGVAQAFGITERITSPTFVIMKTYPLHNQVFETLIHIDAYRLTNAHELCVLGWNEMIKNPNNVICIEWPERVGHSISAQAYKLTLSFIDEHTRELTEANPEREEI